MGDYISRQMVIDALRTCYDTETITMDNGDEYINYEDAVGEIEQLPSIHETGWWIEHKNADIVDGHYISMYECSCCHVWKHNNGDYCPYCGMKMYGTIMKGEK